MIERQSLRLTGVCVAGVGLQWRAATARANMLATLRLECDIVASSRDIIDIKRNEASRRHSIGGSQTNSSPGNIAQLALNIS